MRTFITLILLTLPWTASSEEIRTASPEEIEVIEKNMDQMKFILDPSTVKVKSMALTDQTYCGRIDATRKNGTKMTDFTVYGTWFWGEAVAPIATGVAARRMCDKDKFPPK